MPGVFSELRRWFSSPVVINENPEDLKKEIALSPEAQAAIRLVESFDPLNPPLTPETVLSNIRAILDLGFTLSKPLSIKSAEHKFLSWKEGEREPIEFDYGPESLQSLGNTLALKDDSLIGAARIRISQPPSLHRDRMRGPEDFLPVIADGGNNDWNKLSKSHLYFMLKCIENNLSFHCSPDFKKQIIDFIKQNFK